MRARSALVALAVCAGTLFIPRAAAAPPPCTEPDHPGGDWPSLNHDLQNSRHQPQEDTIGTAEVADLAPAWTLSVSEATGADAGPIQSTPVVAGGCVFVASQGGWVLAIDAETGGSVWQTNLGGELLGLAVRGNLVYALPHSAADLELSAAALDRSTGDVRWRTQLPIPPDHQPRDGNDITASPVVFDNILFVPLAGGGGDGAAVPFFFLHAISGKHLKTTYAIPAADREEGYGGAGAWSTAAVDPTEKMLYVGTADSEGYTKQHPHNQAILRIDVARGPGFGEVVGSYKGRPETYVDIPGWEDNPVCQTFGPEPVLPSADDSQSLECGELDLDFGASPNLFRATEEGPLLVGAMQKAGVYHAVDTSTMESVWETPLSPPAAAGNAGTASVDGERIVASANPATIAALDPGSGLPAWASQTGADALRYQPITTANGVAYTISVTGTLTAFEAATGLPLLARPVSGDVGASCVNLGGGVAVARNTVFAQCDQDDGGNGWVVAYRPGADGGDGGPPSVPEAPEPPSGASNAVVAVPGSAVAGFANPDVTITEGGSLDLVNTSPIPHNVRAFGVYGSDDRPWCDTYPDGSCPLFWSETVTVQGGGTASVDGVEDLAPGTYPFFCNLHPDTMQGTLTVT